MHTGRLVHIITLQKPVATGAKDSFGAPIRVWTDMADVWCDLSPASALSPRGAQREILDGALYGLDPIVVTMLPYPGITVDWRFRYYNAEADWIETYEIKGVRPSNRVDGQVLIASKISEDTT